MLATVYVIDTNNIDILHHGKTYRVSRPTSASSWMLSVTSGLARGCLSTFTSEDGQWQDALKRALLKLEDL